MCKRVFQFDAGLRQTKSIIGVKSLVRPPSTRASAAVTSEAPTE